MIQGRGVVSRRFGVGAAGLLLTAAIVRVMTVPLEPARLAAEGVISVLVIAAVAASSQLTRVKGWGHGAFLVVYAAVLAGLADVGLLSCPISRCSRR